MSQVISFGALDGAPQTPALQADSPFRIGILGDFSGRANQGRKSTTEKLKNRKARKIDRDNFDKILAKFKPKLTLTLPKQKEPIELSVTGIEDFEPDELVMGIDAFADCDSGYAKTLLMNALLHHPDVQALEGGWRSVEWLLKRVSKRDAKIQIVLYNMSFDEFCGDLTGSDDLTQTAVYHLLVEKIADDPKGEPWGLLLGNYIFDVTPQHAEVLGRMAKIAKAAGVAFFANAAPHLTAKSTTIEDVALEQWNNLRQLPESTHLGLAAPRFLVRPPYGEATRAVERFRYEEFTDPKDNCYLWGGGAFACAALVGTSFGAKGWAFVPGEHIDLPEMYMHVWRDEDDDEHMTVAETWLKKNSTERLVKFGIMPLLCIKKRDAMQLLRFQSLAQPPKGQESVPLAGRWGQGNLTKQGAGSPPPSGSVVIGGPGEAPAQATGMPQASAPPAATPDTPATATAPPSNNDVAPAPAAPEEEEMDPELAAMLAEMDSAPEQAAAEPEEEEMDPELAALLAEMDSPAEPAATESAPAEEEEVDPELAALLADLDGGDEEVAETPAEEPATEDEEDPELAALLADLEGASEEESTTSQISKEDEEDPELAALLADLEGGSGDDQEEVATETSSTVAAEEDEEDPELAALLADLEGDTEEESAEEETPTPNDASEEEDDELAALLAELESEVDERNANGVSTALVSGEPATEEAEVDPELAALLADLEGETNEEETGEPTAEVEDEEDPELAALLADLEADDEEPEGEVSPPSIPEETAIEEDEEDAELAALLADLESDNEQEDQVSPPSEEAPDEESDEDPELAALLSELEEDEPESIPETQEQYDPSETEGTETQQVNTATENSTDLAEEIRSLGGRKALEDLGWPTFVPTFAEDLPRQLAILKSQMKHSATEQEVQELLQECGGYEALGKFGVTAEQGLRTQLAGLRQIRKDIERVRALTDTELQSLAQSYGADLDRHRTDQEKIDLLLKVREYHEWATQPNNAEIAATLEKVSFSAKRRTQLEHQLTELGGAAAYYEWIANHPQDGQQDPTLEAEVAVLEMLREYNALGGEEVYQQKVAGSNSRPETLVNKLEQLQAALTLE